MFSYIYRILRNLTLAGIVSVAIVSCSDESNGLDSPQQQMPESGYITLSLNCVEGSRAPSDYTEDGLDTFNENWIESVTLCLWSYGGDKPDNTAVPDYVQTFKNVDKEKTATLRIPLTTALKHKLFDENPDHKCHVFAAVNVDPPVGTDGKFTIQEYRNKAVESTFSSQRVQTSFTMDGDSDVVYHDYDNTATGSVDLQRSASKISLALAVDKEVTQSVVLDGTLVTSKWKPDTGNMRVWLNGGLSESTLDPDLSATPSKAYFFDTPDNLTYSFEDNKDYGNAPGEYKYDFGIDCPFYTYPHRWSAEPGDYAATYMTLAIPWMRVDDDGNQVPGSTWRTCYYQVPVIAADSDILQLIRNVSYHVYLHVGLLGSFIPDEPLLLEDLEYSIAEWGNVNMDVKIPDVRYLVVDQNNYTVNNETSIVIPFYTSHETVVTDATMTFYRYNFDDVGREMPVTVSMAQNEESAKTNRAGAPVFTADFDNETKELKVTHELKIYDAFTNSNAPISYTDNDGPDVKKADRMPKTDAQWKSMVLDRIAYFKQVSPAQDEYSRVEFKITLQHIDMKGSPNFKEEITIYQYPGMYITAVPNYCPTNNKTFSYNGAQGNTIINGNWGDITCNSDQPSGGKTDGWMTSIGLETDNFNFNPNMYLVTITTLPEGTEYRIGDPRSSLINNNLGSNTSYTNNYTGTKRTITTGINGPVLTAENKNPWKGQKYTWSGNTTGITVEGFKTGKSIYPNGGNRTLSYYYPTLEDDNHQMIIAPKFRICSSYAGTRTNLNRELARRRGAAYQELGYPAGRWRLPTYGEVKFIMELSAQYKIPRLFGHPDNTWYYWSAQGLVCVRAKTYTGSNPCTLPSNNAFVNPTGNTPDVQRARFVYDEWYWGEADLQSNGQAVNRDAPTYTFTWGDKPF